MLKKFTIVSLISTMLMSMLVPVTATAVTVDQELTDRLKGYTLLSVDGRGELYYVNPDTGVAKYLGTHEATWDVIKTEMIGITDADLARVATDASLRTRLMGRFLLAVENDGEVHYLRPSDEKLHYLGTGASTFDKLKFLALGINSENLNKLNLDLGFGTEEVVVEDVVEEVAPATYTDGQMAYDFMDVFTAGYEEFKNQFTFYPEMQYFEALLEWNQPIYLTETGFSLAPGAKNYFVWEKVDAEFKDFYFNYLEKDMTLYSFTFKYWVPNEISTKSGVLVPGFYFDTHTNGFLTEIQYANLVNSEEEPVVDEEMIANTEAARVIEAIRIIQAGVIEYAQDNRNWPMTGLEPLVIGETGSILSTEGHFWGSPEDKQIYIEYIPSGLPSTHFVYYAPEFGQPYSLTFELHGFYEDFTPGKYEAIPNDKIRRVGDLD